MTCVFWIDDIEEASYLRRWHKLCPSFSKECWDKLQTSRRAKEDETCTGFNLSSTKASYFNSNSGPNLSTEKQDQDSNF